MEVTLSEKPPYSETARNMVRLDFNPSDNRKVDYVKHHAAILITEMEELRAQDNGLAAREASIAITDLEKAVMWAVKALTKKDYQSQ